MFDRFTERARRVIFFGRYEASNLSSGFIEVEHLLLGLIREDKALQDALSIDAMYAIRAQIEGQFPRLTPSIPISVDLPLSHDSQRVLTLAVEESDRLRHKLIDTGHLVLALFRLEGHVAMRLLRQHGVEYQSYRANIRVPVPDQPATAASFDPEAQVETIEGAPPALRPGLRRLRGIVGATLPHLAGYSEADSGKILKRAPWTRKEALGHLVDYASAHQQWFARALTEPHITALAYPPYSWVSAQRYRDFSRPILVDLWGSLNHLLIHVVTHVPEEKVNTPCRIGVEEPIPLWSLVSRYALHCEDIAGQILAHL
jgi:hypothetical protein